MTMQSAATPSADPVAPGSLQRGLDRRRPSLLQMAGLGHPSIAGAAASLTRALGLGPKPANVKAGATKRFDQAGREIVPMVSPLAAVAPAARPAPVPPMAAAKPRSEPDVPDTMCQTCAGTGDCPTCDGTGQDEPDDDDDDREVKGEGRAGRARLRERERVSAILSSPHAVGRVDAALKLALNTPLSRQDAIRQLSRLPKDEGAAPTDRRTALAAEWDATHARANPPGAGRAHAPGKPTTASDAQATAWEAAHDRNRPLSEQYAMSQPPAVRRDR